MTSQDPLNKPFTIAQITDAHVGPRTSRRTLASVAARGAHPAGKTIGWAIGGKELVSLHAGDECCQMVDRLGGCL